MPFYPEPLPVPSTWQTAELRIRPLRRRDVDLDYDAVMASQTMLRLWSGSDWPRTDFTREENLADLTRHEDEHEQRLAFTYTVLTPEEDECLGCIYINPLANLVAANPGQLTAVADTDATVRFWVKQPRLADRLDDRLLQVLLNWFSQAWAFRRLLWHTHEQYTRQQALFTAAGLVHQFTLTVPSRSNCTVA